MALAVVAGWVIKNGMREQMSELVPALLAAGITDPCQITSEHLVKMQDKLSKKTMQILEKKLNLQLKDGDTSPSKKKRKPTVPVELPQPIELNERDLTDVVFINRAPVLQLWTTCCCRDLGFTDIQSLALASAYVRDMSERKKKLVGLYVEKPPTEQDLKPKTVHQVFGFDVGIPEDKDDLESFAERSMKYMQNAFGESFIKFFSAFSQRASTMGKEAVASYMGYEDYERFRPPTSAGSKGFGEKSRFRLSMILG